MADTDKNPGSARIQGGLVYYLYKAPASKVDLKNELTVLQGFLNAWNHNAGDTSNPTRYPAQSHAPPPATILLVTSLHHPSVSANYAHEANHISVYPCTDSGWSQNDYGAHVHIFSNNADPAHGYHSYHMLSKKRHALNSPGIKQAIADAMAKDFGTLGQGDLA